MRRQQMMKGHHTPSIHGSSMGARNAMGRNNSMSGEGSRRHGHHHNDHHQHNHRRGSIGEGSHSHRHHNDHQHNNQRHHRRGSGGAEDSHHNHHHHRHDGSHHDHHDHRRGSVGEGSDSHRHKHSDHHDHNRHHHGDHGHHQNHHHEHGREHHHPDGAHHDHPSDEKDDSRENLEEYQSLSKSDGDSPVSNKRPTGVIQEGSISTASSEGQKSFIRRRERDASNETMAMLKANLQTRQKKEPGEEGKVYGKVKSFARTMLGPMQGDNFPTNTFMIHPNSAFAAGLFMFSGLLLVYSAVQTPVDIGFYWEQDICDTDLKLLQFNMFVDTFFCVEVCLTFFVGIIDKGTYVDDFKTVARIYLTGRFWFDILTSLPTSWADWAGTQNCGDASDDGEESSAVQALRFVRVLKPVRLVKLLRIFKVARIFDVLDRILRLSPQVVKVGKLTFGVTLLTHLFSCVFWLLKSQTDSEFIEFTDYHNVTRGTVAEKWLLSMYFINTVFTTVGFGDVSGDNNVDRVFCVVIMWAGTAVFAIIINGLQQAGEEINEKNKAKNDHIQTVVRFMRDKKVPMWLEQEVKSWVSFQHESNERIQERNKVMQDLPERLQKSLCMQINSHLISQAWIFQKITHIDAGELLKRLVLKTKNQLRFKGELIASEDDEAHAMYIVEHGQVRVELSLDDDEMEEDGDPPHDILRRGDWFGELSLVGCKSWGGAYGVRAEYIAQENCELIELSRDAFEDVVAGMSDALYNEIHHKAYEVWNGMNRMGIQLASKSNSTELRAQAISTRWEILTRAMLSKHEASSRFGHVLLNFATRRSQNDLAPSSPNALNRRRRRSSAGNTSTARSPRSPRAPRSPGAGPQGPLSARTAEGQPPRGRFLADADGITEEGAEHPAAASAAVRAPASAPALQCDIVVHSGGGSSIITPRSGGSGTPVAAATAAAAARTQAAGVTVSEIGLVTAA